MNSPVSRQAVFGTKPTAPKEGAPGGETEKPKPQKVELVAIIDTKRATAISTVIGNLKSMKLDTDAVIAALLDADLKRLENPRMPVR